MLGIGGTRHTRDGKFAPGTRQGRQPTRVMPEWLKDKGEAFLELQVQAATTGVMPVIYAEGQEPLLDEAGNEVRCVLLDATTRMKVLDKLCDRIYGKSPSSPEELERREEGVADLLASLVVKGPMA